MPTAVPAPPSEYKAKLAGFITEAKDRTMYTGTEVSDKFLDLWLALNIDFPELVPEAEPEPVPA